MATKVTICNGAAIELGKDPVFSDPARIGSASPTGQALAAAWDEELPAAVAAYPWNFACKRQVIAVAEFVPSFGWATAYEKPGDLLKVRDINFRPNCPREKFIVEGDYILANCSGPANLRYIAKIFDPAKFDAEFVTYLQVRLAAKVAFKVTGSETREQTLINKALGLVADAKSSDAQEADEPDDDPPGELLEFRSRVT